MAWTLVLLFLGSVVHATESSLACPDWPTCYGSWMPEMTGGVFWEHLHRLVAGGLVLLWLLATWAVWPEGRERPLLRRGAIVGIVILVIQSVLGGVTVLLLLPPAISSAHLGLAFLFLALATGLAVATHPEWRRRAAPPAEEGRRLRLVLAGAALVVFAQSLLGGWVRHIGAGLACPDLPLCLHEWVPPLEQTPIAIHWLHRVAGVVTAGAVLAAAGWVAARTGLPRLRRGAAAAGALVLLQVGLGFLSVGTFLAVLPVSLHTLVAAALLALLTAMAVWSGESVGSEARPFTPARAERSRPGPLPSSGFAARSDRPSPG